MNQRYRYSFLDQGGMNVEKFALIERFAVADYWDSEGRCQSPVER